MKIKLIKSSFYHEAKTKKSLIEFIKKTKVLSLNDECRKFEKAFAKKQGRKYAVFVSSGSSANLVLVQALLNLKRLKRGDRVAVSALTWSTNMMPLIQLGLKPVAVDVSLKTLNPASKDLEKVSKKVKAFFTTNVLGFCDDLEKIEKLCVRKKIIFLEDNCESLGSRYKKRNLGNFSLASTFSFFVGHHLSTIEGGMICTDDEELYHMLVMVRAHGWDRQLTPEARERIRTKHDVEEFYGNYTFYCLAFNARPTEINGKIGNEQIKYWNDIVWRREKNFFAFQKAIEKNPDFIPLEVNHMDKVSNFAVPVVAKEPGVIEKYKKRFKEAGVEIRPVLAGNMTLQPFFSAHVPERHICPNAELIHTQGFYFPNNPELTDREVQYMVRLLQPHP